MAVFMTVFLTRAMHLHPAPAAVGPPATIFAPAHSPPLGSFQAYFFLVIYGGEGALALGAAAVKFIGAVKLLRRARNAWGWGLAAGIVGCVELWCSLGCVIPLAVGIYTIIILCFEHVRRYMQIAPPGFEVT